MSADPRREFGAEGSWIGQPIGHFEAWRRAADERGDFGQNFGQRQILAAENVALANPTAFGRQKMARRADPLRSLVLLGGFER